MAKGKSHSRYYNEYMRERKRIQRFLSIARKKGFEFDFSLPTIPKNITQASVSRLSNITPEKLYKKSTYTDFDSGEITSGIKGREIRKQRGIEKARATREFKRKGFTEDYRSEYEYTSENIYTNELILQKIERLIDDFFTSRRDKSNYQQAFQLSNNETLKRILEDAIEDEGRVVVAERISNYSNEIAHLIDSVQHASRQDVAVPAIVQFATIIKGSSLTLHESERISDYANMYTDFNG